ncbi:unnamed protein product, partial [Didymodactylos carnosus]
FGSVPLLALCFLGVLCLTFTGLIVIALIPVYLKTPSMHERLPVTNPVSVEPIITKSQLDTSTTTFRLTAITTKYPNITAETPTTAISTMPHETEHKTTNLMKLGINQLGDIRKHVVKLQLKQAHDPQ